MPQEIVSTARNSRVYVGEMSPEDMRQSMLHPEKRRLEQLIVDDFEDFSETIEILMGEKVDQRRDFLFENVDFSKLNGQ